MTKPKYIEVMIKASKIDVFRKGFTVYLDEQVLKSAQWCYPELITSRDAAGGPFIRFSDGRSLTWMRFVEEVRAALQQAGVQ